MGFVPAQKLSGIVRTQPKTARIQLSAKFTKPSKSWLLKLPKKLGGTYYHTFNCVRGSKDERPERYERLLFVTIKKLISFTEL